MQDPSIVRESEVRACPGTDAIFPPLAGPCPRCGRAIILTSEHVRFDRDQLGHRCRVCRHTWYTDAVTGEAVA